MEPGVRVWVIEFDHPGSCKREFRVFDSYEHASETLRKWEAFDPHLWEL